MRVWWLHPAYLDTRRLLDLHNNVHALVTCVLNGRRWTKYPQLLRQSLSYARDVHLSVVEELCRRSPLFGPFSLEELYEHHESDFPTYDPAIYDNQLFTPSFEMVRQDVADLRSKWEAEGYYFGIGRWDLCDQERVFFGPLANLGPTREEALQIQKQTRDRMKRFRIWFDAFKTLFPKSRIQDRLQVFNWCNRNNWFLIHYMAQDPEGLTVRAEEMNVTPTAFVYQCLRQAALEGHLPDRFDPTPEGHQKICERVVRQLRRQIQQPQEEPDIELPLLNNLERYTRDIQGNAVEHYRIAINDRRTYDELIAVIERAGGRILDHGQIQHHMEPEGNDPNAWMERRETLNDMPFAEEEWAHFNAIPIQRVGGPRPNVDQEQVIAALTIRTPHGLVQRPPGRPISRRERLRLLRENRANDHLMIPDPDEVEVPMPINPVVEQVRPDFGAFDVGIITEVPPRPRVRRPRFIRR